MHRLKSLCLVAVIVLAASPPWAQAQAQEQGQNQAAAADAMTDAMTDVPGATIAPDPDYVPLGVYWGFPRNRQLAEYRGVDLWEDVGQRLDLMVENGVDTVWVNIATRYVGRLAQACEARGIRLLAHPWSLEIRNLHGVGDRRKTPIVAPDEQASRVEKHYQRVMPELLEQAAGADSVAAWVISDEPQKGIFPALEHARQVARKIDPTRLTLTVTQKKTTPLAIEPTAFPVLVEDIYGLFAPGNPNGPYTDAAFTAYYRNRVARFVDAVLADDRVAWAMTQAFGQVRGPRKMDERGHMIALPGSYRHWTMPSPAQVKWQAWEAIRAGAKGVIVYIATPKVPDPKTATLPPYDNKGRFEFEPVQSPTDTGPIALTTPDAQGTPQLEALGEAYHKIGPHTPLIQRWQRDHRPGVDAGVGFAVGMFRTPDGGRYAVIVNDDFDHERTATLQLPGGVTALKDLVADAQVPVHDGSATVTIPAGGGTILRLSGLRPRR